MDLIWLGLGAMFVGGALLFFFWPMLHGGEMVDAGLDFEAGNVKGGIYLGGALLILGGLGLVVYAFLRIVGLVN